MSNLPTTFGALASWPGKWVYEWNGNGGVATVGSPGRVHGSPMTMIRLGPARYIGVAMRKRATTHAIDRLLEEEATARKEKATEKTLQRKSLQANANVRAQFPDLYFNANEIPKDDVLQTRLIQAGQLLRKAEADRTAFNKAYSPLTQKFHSFAQAESLARSAKLFACLLLAALEGEAAVNDALRDRRTPRKRKALFEALRWCEFFLSYYAPPDIVTPVRAGPGSSDDQDMFRALLCGLPLPQPRTMIEKLDSLSNTKPNGDKTLNGFVVDELKAKQQATQQALPQQAPQKETQQVLSGKAKQLGMKQKKPKVKREYKEALEAFKKIEKEYSGRLTEKKFVEKASKDEGISVPAGFWKWLKSSFDRQLREASQ